MKFTVLLDADIRKVLQGRAIFFSSRKYPYPCFKLSGRKIYVHHVVVGIPLRGLVVDHINGNVCDCRRQNLRIVTRRENGLNRFSHRNGRLYGATKLANGYWKAQIRFGKKRIHSGRYLTELEAHQAYLNMLASVKGVVPCA